MTTTASPFRYELAETIFTARLKREGVDTWNDLARLVAQDVCGGVLSASEVEEIAQMIDRMEFIPGGRYLAYAGRSLKYFQNCYALISEHDTRENWSDTYHKASSCLMTGGGIGNNYSLYRASGAPLRRTGGIASGPIPCMMAVNEIGRASVQGGGRRSAIYASLAREHGDVHDFLALKNWHEVKIPGTEITLKEAKEADFDFPCPMDHTNISVQYGDEWLGLEDRASDEVFVTNCRQAMRTAEPGMQFDFGDQANHIGRNACTEFITDNDSDACNLGSVNMSRIESVKRFAEVCELAAKFLYCGTMRSHTPYNKVATVRDCNRRIGLGLMGVHEWLLKREMPYEVGDGLRAWLTVYKSESERGANAVADQHGLPRPKAYRAIAPTGTIGIYAGTTTGIEPIYAVAYKRRYREGMAHRYQYVVDATAKVIINELGTDPEKIETALSLSKDVGRRIKFQADIQDFVDMGISSTVNLPAWGTEHNNEDCVTHFAETLAEHAPRLRGITFYPDGARGGQPIEEVPYEEATRHEGKNFAEEFTDVCALDGTGSCND